MDVYDPDEVKRKVYFEYLADRYGDNPGERRHRENRFENDDAHDQDREAIKQAGQAYAEKFGSGEALNAARDAFYVEKFRHEFIRTNADPNRYSKNAEYRAEWYDKGTVFATGKVEERRQEQAQHSTGLASTINPDSMKEQSVDPSTQELIDCTRGMDGRASSEHGPNSPAEVIDHTLNSGRNPASGNAGSAQDLIDHTRGVNSLPEHSRSNRNDRTRYDSLKNPSQPPPRFRR